MPLAAVVVLVHVNDTCSAPCDCDLGKRLTLQCQMPQARIQARDREGGDRGLDEGRSGMDHTVDDDRIVGCRELGTVGVCRQYRGIDLVHDQARLDTMSI